MMLTMLLLSSMTYIRTDGASCPTDVLLVQAHKFVQGSRLGLTRSIVCQPITAALLLCLPVVLQETTKAACSHWQQASTAVWPQQ